MRGLSVFIFLSLSHLSAGSRVRGGMQSESARQSAGSRVRGGMQSESARQMGCTTGEEITPAVARKGEIRTSVQGSSYANNHKCTWKLTLGDTGASVASISLNFKSFDLEKRGAHTHKCHGTCVTNLLPFVSLACKEGICRVPCAQQRSWSARLFWPLPLAAILDPRATTHDP